MTVLQLTSDFLESFPDRILVDHFAAHYIIIKTARRGNGPFEYETRLVERRQRPTSRLGMADRPPCRIGLLEELAFEFSVMEPDRNQDIVIR